ncbi:MAG: hypothetical protein ABI658_27660 [Acidimicrobiales bacterium]
MTIDVEHQLHAYSKWVEQRLGVPLSAPSAQQRTLIVTQRRSTISSTVELRRLPSDGDRRRHRGVRVLVAAAVLAIVAAGAVAVKRHLSSPTTQYASTAAASLNASWYVIDPALAVELDAVRNTDSDGFAGPLACRRYSIATQTCDELVGSRMVRYRVGGAIDGQVLIETEYGPAVSILSQIARADALPVTISGHNGIIVGPDYDNRTTIQFEPSPGTRVLIQLVRETAGNYRDVLVRIAESLTIKSVSAALPIVFGDTLATAEESGNSDPPRYIAGYLRLAPVQWSTDDSSDHFPCVGGFSMPWNNASDCRKIEHDDKVTVTVASPSPAGTIIIAAVPAATTRLEAQADGQPPLALDLVAVPGFALQLTFADLDAYIPTRLVAYSADGAVVDTVTVTSTGGAPLGYLPRN